MYCADKDVSASFKRLQAERTTADNVLRSHTPLQSISDIYALQTYLVAISSAATVRRNFVLCQIFGDRSVSRFC